jgi:hypothetical protein
MNRVAGLFALAVVGAYAPSSSAEQSNQKTYPSAAQAAQELFSAVLVGDEQDVLQILGNGNELFSTDDRIQDDLDRQTFLEKYQEMHRLVVEPPGTILYVGAENWPFPIPLVSKNGAWSFDTEAGAQEILARRVGANESFAIDVCHSLARPDGRDAAALVGSPIPSHGYYFRAVPAQGESPVFLAYPAEYRSSGVMTFVVDSEDVVSERDLGPHTEKVARDMNGYKPDPAWRKSQ